MSPTSSWGQQATPASGTETPVSVLLVGEVGQRLLTWQQSVTMDARFRMAALANDPSDLQAKLSYSPEVVILDAMIFKGPQMLLQALTSITGAAYVILPAWANTSDDPEVKELPGKLKTLPSVKQIFIGDAPISDLLQRAYGDALALRKTIAAPMSWATRNQGMASVSGLRVIAVWNRVGGVGKTTIAAALALAVARRGLRSLLVGLDAPDVMPLHLSLKSEPNILGWFAIPTDTGIRNSLQQVGNLDVLAGFPDILAEKTGLEAEEKNSIASLVTTAAYGGYAAIILDAPPSSGMATPAVHGGQYLGPGRPPDPGGRLGQRGCAAHRHPKGRRPAPHRPRQHLRGAEHARPRHALPERVAPGSRLGLPQGRPADRLPAGRGGDPVRPGRPTQPGCRPASARQRRRICPAHPRPGRHALRGQRPGGSPEKRRQEIQPGRLLRQGKGVGHGCIRLGRHHPEDRTR